MGMLDGLFDLIPHYAGAGLGAAGSTVDLATDSVGLAADDVRETVDGVSDALGLGSIFT